MDKTQEALSHTIASLLCATILLANIKGEIEMKSGRRQNKGGGTLKFVRGALGLCAIGFRAVLVTSTSNHSFIPARLSNEPIC